jgi:hypothetical protein
MLQITKIFKIIRCKGFGECLFLAQYLLRKKLGLLKWKFPLRSWAEMDLIEWLEPEISQLEDFFRVNMANGRRFFFKSEQLPGLNKCYAGEVLSHADKILDNKLQLFFDKHYDLVDSANWLSSPLTGHALISKHWSDVTIFDPDLGDIKFIWEPSRFAWVYTLIRAYAATSDEKYSEKFWNLFETWLEANQPNMGHNYVCGQECAIRLMAMCFAYYGLAQSQSSTIERKIKLVTAIAVHADRIEKNIYFAISTKTNHSITEAVGIYTAGLLFPELKESGRWFELGKRIFTNEVLRQIDHDGSYIQQSMNYHRLMLQDCLWAIRLAELNNTHFSKQLLNAVQKAGEFLYQMQDDYNGRVPNYGANDGSLIIPLNNCDYLDYRPVLNAINYLFQGRRLYQSGQWDEDLIWFFGPDARNAPVQSIGKQSSCFNNGGYYTLRGDQSWAMTRCHTHKSRPSHADMLSLDLWYKDINILRDSGTFIYNCEEPWQSYFSSTSSHNTVTIDGKNQMSKGPRFMWFDWTKSKLIMHKSFKSGYAQIFQGQHYGYCRDGMNVIHQRAVLTLDDKCWLIVDDVLGNGRHESKAVWNLADIDYDLSDNMITMNSKYGLVCIAVLSSGQLTYECGYGNEDIPAGWQSLYYGQRQPAPAFICTANCELPLRIITLISLGDSLKKIVLRDNDAISWSLEKSQQEYIVGINSIDNSEKAVFTFSQDSTTQVSFN